MWKRILTLVLVLFASVTCFFACGDSGKYDNMSIVIKNVQGLSDDNVFVLSSSNNSSVVNTFSFDVEVVGVGRGVDKSVECFLSDNKLKESSAVYNESTGITSFEFEVIDGGTSSIIISTVEGNKTYDLIIKIEVPVELVSFKNKVLAVVRGEEYSIKSDNLSFYPETTTQTQVHYQITAIDDGDNEDVSVANDYLSQNGKILINSTLRYFYLDVYSDYIDGESQQSRAIVNVIDKIEASKVGIVENREDTSDYGSYELLSFENNKYTLTLASNSDQGTQFRTFSQTTLQFVYGEGESPMGEETFNGYILNEAGEFTLANNEKFSIRLKDISASDNDKYDLGIAEMGNKNSSDFDFEISSKSDGEMTLTFIIDYKGFEGVFEPIEIPLTIKVSMFPHEIRVYSSKDAMERAKSGKLSNDTYNVKNDGELILYTSSTGSDADSYLLTPVYVCVWGEDYALNNQEVALSINNSNVSIVDSTGENPVEFVYSGGVFYLKKVNSIEGELKLTITSVIYENVSTEIVLSYTDEAVNVQFEDISVDLDIATFSNDQTKFNGKEVSLVAENIVKFAGLPKLANDKMDYSVVEVVFASDDYAEAKYNSDSNDIIIRPKNKIGSTMIKFVIKDVYTSNGKEFESGWKTFSVNYPLNSADLLKAQIEGFENVENGEYQYRFVGSEQDTVTYKTELLAGQTYNLYFLLGEDDESSQKYTDISLFASLEYANSSNSAVVGVNGRLINVKSSSSKPITVVYCYSPKVGSANQALDRIYIVFEIYTRSAIKNLTTTSPKISLYDYNSISQNIKNPVTGYLYCDEVGVADFEIGLNPTDANVEYTLSWSVIINGSALTPSVQNNKEDKVYTFTTNRGAQIVLTAKGLTASLKVLSIPEDGVFSFELRAVAEQTYIQPAYTKDATNVGSSRIALNIPVTVKKASSISSISIGAFNNTVKFDTRDMAKNGEDEYIDNNEVRLDYELKTSGNIDNVVIKDVEFYVPNSDIEIACDNNQVRITYKAMSIDEPEYEIYMVALGSLNGKWSSGVTIDYSNVTTYYNVYSEIIVKVANGKTIPFEIDSAEDLIAIGNTSRHPEAMTSNYVLTTNIDLKDYNWEAIGGGEEFNGTLTGRYYLGDNTYNDYEIYNLTINVSSSDSANENNYFGLFGCIGEKAIISNITLKNFNVKIGRGTNTPLVDYIGVLAGKNNGQIIDCTIDDGIIVDALNGALIAMGKTGISYDTIACGITTDANIGGLVGFNDTKGVIKSCIIKINIGIMDYGASASASVMAGGMVGKNSGTIYGGNTKEVDETVVYSNNFVATSGISGFDVVAVINAHRDGSKVSSKSAYGGVVGSNFENGAYAEILGVTARSFVFGSGNIGGLVGQNNAKISNSLVIPNLIGSGNIGGLVGYASGSSKSVLASRGRNIILSNKVQVINYNDSYSFMNTAIYATSGSNVGGLIGVYEGEYTMSRLTDEGTLSISFTSSLGYNSVRSYMGESISPEYSKTDANTKYYGDIVIAKGSTNVNVSGFIGKANNIMVASGYAKTTIVFEAGDSIYVGGVLGKGSEIVSIFNFSALGVVYNISTSVKSNNIGNFIGDATNINTISLRKGQNIDGSYLLNILYRVSDDAWNSEYNNLVAYNLDGDSPANDIKTGTRYYIDRITLSADANSLSYKYANVMYSYSTIQARNYYYSQISEQKEYYVNNFFANNETITITNNIGGSVYYRENGSKSQADSIEFTNVVATNSFYIGFTISKFHNGTTVKELGHTVNTNNISPNAVDENGFNLFGYNASSYSNTLVVKINKGGEPIAVINSNSNDTEYAYYGTGLSKNRYNGLYLCSNSETGLNGTLPTGYLRYYNEDVDGGCVLPFAYENTYSKDSVDYVNLIVDIPPTILKTTTNLEVDVDNGKLLSSESSTVDDTTTISYKTNTLVYYQLDYSKLDYSIMSINGVDTKVIDFNQDKTYSSLDISYSNYVNELINSKNIYKLSEAVDISILPPFLQSGLVSFKSSNSDVAYIEVIDGEAYIVVCGEGVVTFTVYSIYNQDGEKGTGDNVATFVVNIISKVDDFGIYSDMTLNSSSELFTDDSSLVILKSNTRSTQVYVNLKAQLDYANDYLKAYSKVDLALKNNNSYGVMIFYIHNNSIYIDGEVSHNGIKINDKSFSKLTFGSDYDKVGAGKYALYVDAGNEVSFTGLEVLEGLKLLVVPYIKHSDNTRTILYDLNFNGVVRNDDDLTGGIAKIITLRVIEGSESVSSVDSASFLPNNTLETKVSIKTDNTGAQLFLNVSKDEGTYLAKVDIYSNIEKTTKCEYITNVSNYPDKVFDDLGVEMGLGTYYFDKVYITVSSIAFENGQKEYLFRIGVCDKYLFDNDLIANYVLNFNIVNLEAEMSTSTTRLAISGQSITNSIASTFSSIDEYLEDKTVYDLADYYESSTLVAGYPGLLQIDLFPEYANVDYVEITSEVISGYYVSMEQMVAVFNASGVFDGYYKIYNEKRDIINDGAGIRVKNYSYFFNNDYKYSGTYYIRTIIPTTPKGIDSFTITYKCFFDGKVVREKQVVINVARIPDLSLTVNGGKTGVVALGKSINIEAEADSEITWTVNNVYKAVTENNATAPIEVGNGVYSVNIKSISVLGADNYKNYVGKDMVITATVELDIKGRVYRVSDSVTIRLALFTIDDIEVKNVSNGYFHGTYNQPYDLRLTLVASYDEAFDKANGNFISTAISSLSNQLSYYSARSFYIIEGSDVSVLEPGQYSDMLVTRNGNYLTIKNNRKNVSSNLKASITFTYSTYDETNYGIYFYTANDFCYNVENRFGLDFIRLSNEENPEPIYTAAELMNMEEGGYYILLDDITLTDWEPLDIAIASLDGNGYVLTVESFDYVTLEAPEAENEKDGELTLGIFSKIYENTVIKNLIIEVKTNEKLTSDVLDTKTGDIVINAQYYSDVTFGLLAGTNEGIITNVNITNNANSYRNQRNKLLRDSGAITEYTSLSENSARKLAIINVDNGSTSSTASENRIAVMVGVNSGYISNSSVSNVSIYGLDCVAGFVAENKNIISSSFFSGGNVHANVSSDKSKTLGASGFVFENSGKILYSYVAGMTGTNTNLTGINISGFAGSTYSSNAINLTTPKISLRFMDTGVVSENGNTSSFVYTNGGKISDCYSNFLVYGSETSGFVYSNSGEINNVYTLSSVIAKSSIHNPFISMVSGAEAGAVEPNNSGSITNAFFLSVTADELLDEEGSTIAGLEADQFLNSTNQVAQPISANKFSNYSTFDSFAFNANMDSLSSIDDVTAIEEIVRSVWFYPSSVTNNSIYFKQGSYSIGAPQLVSANLNNYSLKYYVTDNETKMIEAVYSSLLDSSYSTFITSLGRADILVDVELKSASAVASIEFSSADNKLEALSNTLNSVYGYTTNSTDLASQNLQYIKVKLYLEGDEYTALTNEESESSVANDIVNTVRAEIKALGLYSLCYIRVEFVNESVNSLPSIDSTYEYVSVLEMSPVGGASSQTVSIEYGSSILNPYLVKNANDYNVFVMRIDENFESNVINNNYQSSIYLRLVKDFAFEGNDSFAKTYNVIYSGVLDGNGMTISSLRVNADTTLVNTLQNSANYDENEVNDSKKATSVGMFAKLVGGGTVKNLSIDVSAVNATGVNFVGAVAGQVIDGRLYNIDTYSTSGATVLGKNIVGGIAGRITGQSSVVNLSSSVSVSAYYYAYDNKVNSKNLELNNQVASRYSIYMAPVVTGTGATATYTSSNFSDISYAGGVAGIVDLDEPLDSVSGTIDITAISRVRSVTVSGSPTILGEVVGGLYGGLGADTVISASAVIIGEGANLNASRVAGGLIGINYGTITRSYIENDDQESIDASIKESGESEYGLYGDNIDNGSQTFFSGNPHYAGGLVGINIGGTIMNSYERVDVTNIDISYAGGLIGATLGGTLNTVYTSANVYAFYGIGGLIGLNSGYKVDADYKDDGSLKDTYDNNIDFANVHLFSHIANPEVIGSASGVTGATINLQAIVAVNMWKFETLTTSRHHINSVANMKASIGSIIGYSDTSLASTNGEGRYIINSQNIVTDMSGRYIDESIYTVASYTYDSIDGGAGLVLLEEVGNYFATSCSPASSTNNSDTVRHYNQMVYSSNQLASGIAIKYELKSSTNGEKRLVIADEGSKVVHYSRFRNLSSVRTLSEIIGRTYNQDLAISMLSRLKTAEGDTSDIATVESLAYAVNNVTLIVDGESYTGSFSGNANKQYVYDLSNWNSQVWRGTQVDHQDELIESNYVLPVLTNNVADKVLEIRTYQELVRYTKLYPNGTFYLMNDITVQGEDVAPLCSRGNPFTGKLMSDPNMTDENKATHPNGFKITINANPTSGDVTGLFSAIKGATFKNLEIVVNTNLSLNSVTNDGSIGVLFGYAYSKGNKANVIENVTISFAEGKKIQVNKGAKYVGVLGGYADALQLKGTSTQNSVTIVNPKIEIANSVSDLLKLESLYVGGVAGYVSIHSANASSYISIQNPEININLNIAGGGYDELAIGSVFGKVTNTSATSGDFTLSNIGVTNPKANVTLSSEAGKFVYFENVGIGGVLGLASGQNSSSLFSIRDITVTSETSYEFNITNNGIYAYSPLYSSKGNFSVGGIIGAVGTDGRGGIQISSINLSTDDKAFTYIHNNQSSNNLAGAKNSSNVNIGASIGAVTTCSGQIQSLNSGLKTRWSITEKDKVNINIGASIGRLENGEIKNVVSTTNIESVITTSDTISPVTLGENTCLNIGGLIGQMSGGSIISSGYNANIVVYTSANSTNNVNIGGLVGLTNTHASTYSISSCFAYGNVVLNSITKSDDIDNSLLHSANIGGMVGKVVDTIKINYAVTANDIILRNGTLEGNVFTSNTSEGLYNGIGGFVGLLYIDDQSKCDFDLVSVYSISNIIVTRNSRSDSKMGGLVGKVITSDGYDVSGQISVTSGYYLANFILDTNNIGTACSVEELLINNSSLFTNDEHWLVAENKYPILRVTGAEYSRLTPHVMNVTTLSSNNFASLDATVSAVIIKSDVNEAIINIADTLNVGSIKDIYFVGVKLTVSGETKIFDSIASNQRVYGINMDSISAPIINTNNGKVSETHITSLTSATGYIATNNGFDIHVEANIASGAMLYGTQSGWTIYGEITTASDKLDGDSSNGEYQLTVINYSATKPTTTSKLSDSYMTNGTDYAYYSHGGTLNTNVTNLDSAKDVLNFVSDYDFYNDWIIFSVPEDATSEYSAKRKDGRVFLRWELSKAVGGKWYFEGIDIYSNTQVAYQEYAWNNYVNYLNSMEDTTWPDLGATISSENITISSAVGLAYASSLINNGLYTNYSIALSEDIDLSGRLFTPIGGALILNKMQSNVFKGRFNGNNHSIKSMDIITNGYGGLFGSSISSSYSDVTISNSHVLSTGTLVGGFVASQQASTVISNVQVSNSTSISLMASSEKTNVVGGVVGQIYNSNPRTNTVSVEITGSGLTSGSTVYSGNYIGGLVGEVVGSTVSITSCFNEYTIKGLDRVGGLVGSAGEGSSIRIYKSHNYGDIIATSVQGIAGGLIGYDKADSTTIQISYNSSYVSGYYASGMIGYLCGGSARFEYTYVSRGDVGAILNGVTNTRNDTDPSVVNNMNTNAISGNVDGGEYAYVYVSDSGISVEILESYSSLYGDDGATALTLTNSSNAIYDNSYVISSSNDNTTEPKQITHASLSQANNEIFDNWKDIWSRVSQKNNNYPVFMDSAWVGSEDGIEKDGENYYIITTEEQLAWVATQVNTGRDDFDGDTIQVGKDSSLTLDFSKKLWSPIGYSTSRNFKGTMDFRNVTIKNLTTNGYYLNGTFNEDNLIKNYVGLFGYTKGATIKGSVTFVTDDTTLNEGSHISTEGRYAGALIGYAMNTMLENLTVVNKLNVQGTVGDVGGIIGGYELSSSFEGSQVTIGNFTNYGSVSGKYEDSQNIGGVIGRISVPDDKEITIRATSMYNYGTIGAGSGSSSGLIALIEGEKVTLDVGVASSNASIENSGTELGGLFGKSEGTLIIGQAIISNDTGIMVASEGDEDAGKIILSSNNTSAHIGAVIGYGNNVTIKTVTYDNDGIKICDKNVLNTTAFNQMSGAIGGFVGYVNNLTLMVRSSLEVKNIEFVHNGEVNENNYIGGIAGMVRETLTVKSEANKTTLTVNNITGIKGIGYLGGVAGYIGRYSMEDVTISVNNVCVEEVTDMSSEHYQEYAKKSEDLLYNTFGSVGGVFGYIGGGASGNTVSLSNITTSSTDNTKYYVKSKTYYAGGIVGKIGVATSLSKLTNNLNVIGDFSSNARDVGGIVGYINTTTGNTSIIEECNNYSSVVTGYEHVGGIVGQVQSVSIIGCETRNTAVGTYDEETHYGSWFVGGIVGEANNARITSSYFTGALSGSNYIGGIVGVTKSTNIYTTTANITSIVAKPSANRGIGSHPDIEIFALGGIVGYIYSNASRSYVINVDVNMAFESDKVNTSGILFGGAIGYASNTDIKEASTYISTLNVPNVYGIVNKLYNSEYSVNWYCNHYWMVGDTDSQENLYMSYVYNLKSESSAIKNTDYDETVIYKLANTEENRDNDTLTTFKFANGNTISGGESVVESYERVKQIYFEAGIWSMTTSNLSATNSLSENVSVSLDQWIYRMVSIEGDTTLNVESAPSEDDSALTYQSIYRGITQRYRPDKTAINLTLTVRDNLSSCGEELPHESTYYQGILQPVKRIDDNGNPYVVDATYSKVYNGERIVLPLGSKFFPINNLTIIGSGDSRYKEGYEGYEQNKVSKIYLPNSNYGVGSTTNTAFNIYGFVGYTTGTVTITNVEFYTEYSGADSFVAERYTGTSTVKSIVSPHAETSADKIVGGVVAIAQNQTVTLDNVSSSISINSGDSYVTGGIIGSSEGSTLNLRGITYKGTISGTSSIAGGVMGYAYNSTINAKQYVNDTMDTTISKSTYEHQCITSFSESISYNTFTDLDEDGINLERKLKYGIKNEGTIYGKYVAGGLFGVIGDTVITSINESGAVTTDEVPLLLWNTGNVRANVSDGESMVGGIAGILQGKNQGYTLRNTYSGNITANYALNGDLTYEYSETQPTYLGSVVGGFVGYAYAENGEPTIEHGVNAVQLVDTNNEIMKVSVGIGAVSASAVSYKDIINFGDVSLNADNLGSFYMEAEWNKPNGVNPPSLTSATTLNTNSFTDTKQEIDRLYLENIINLGDVTSTYSSASVGGLVGGIDSNSYDVVFVNCYNYSNVTGTDESEVGGYIGMMDNGSKTMTISTNSNYSTFLKVVERYVTEDSNPTYITGEFAGGVIGHFYTGNLMGHINTVLNVDDNTKHNYAIQIIDNYTETVTNYVNSTIKLRATDSIITTNYATGYAYVGGVVGDAEDQDVLVFTKIETPKVNATSKAVVGGVVGSVSSTTNGVIAFQSVDVDDVSLTNGEGYGVGGLAGSIIGGRIIGELINVNGDITGYNISTTSDQSVGGLIGMVTQPAIINFNTANISGYITGRTMRGIGVGGLFGSITTTSNRCYLYVLNATVTGTISATAEDGANYSTDSINICAGGIAGYVRQVYSFIVVGSTVRTGVVAEGFASYAGGIVGRTKGSNINVEGDTRVAGGVYANYKNAASYTSESQLSSAGGLIGYSQNSGMTFKDTTISSISIRGYVAGGLIGMVAGDVSLEVDGVDITGSSSIHGYLYMSTVVGMAINGASEKLDEANINMGLSSGVTLNSLCIGNKGNKINLTRKGTQFEAIKTIQHNTYNLSAIGTYSFSYKESDGKESNVSYTDNDIVIEKSVSRTVESFGSNSTDRPILVKSFTIGEVTYNGSYDVFYGNRDKSSSIGSNINITNARLFAWVEEYDMNYIKSNYIIYEQNVTNAYSDEVGRVQFTNNGKVYQSNYQGDEALADANSYGRTGASHMAAEAITAYIAIRNLNVDKNVSSEDLFASNLEYQISNNVKIYRFINPIG